MIQTAITVLVLAAFAAAAGFYLRFWIAILGECIRADRELRRRAS